MLWGAEIGTRKLALTVTLAGTWSRAVGARNMGLRVVESGRMALVPMELLILGYALFPV